MPRFVAAAFLACSPLLAITPTADELQWGRQWAETGFLPDVPAARGRVELVAGQPALVRVAITL